MPNHYTAQDIIWIINELTNWKKSEIPNDELFENRLMRKFNIEFTEANAIANALTDLTICCYMECSDDED